MTHFIFLILFKSKKLIMFFGIYLIRVRATKDKGGSAVSLFVFTLVPGKPVTTIKMYSLFKKGLTRKCSLFPCLPAASLQHADKGGSAISLFVFILVPGKPVTTIKTKRRKLSFTPLSSVAERGGFEPPVQMTPYVSLANWWFQPLTHLS